MSGSQKRREAALGQERVQSKAAFHPSGCSWYRCLCVQGQPLRRGRWYPVCFPAPSGSPSPLGPSLPVPHLLAQGAGLCLWRATQAASSFWKHLVRSGQWEPALFFASSLGELRLGAAASPLSDGGCSSCPTELLQSQGDTKRKSSGTPGRSHRTGASFS